MEPEPIAAGAPTGAEEDGLAESMKPSSWTTGSAVDAPPLVQTKKLITSVEAGADAAHHPRRGKSSLIPLSQPVAAGEINPVT